MGLPLDGWMVEWDPGDPAALKVGPWPDRDGWSQAYTFKTGCFESDAAGQTPAEQMLAVLTILTTLIVRDGADPARAHAEFRKIDAYRRRLGPRIDGTEER